MANEVLKIALGALAFALPAAVLAQTAPAAPNLAQCGRYQPQEGDMELERKGPLPVPAALRPVMASSRDYVAVTTLTNTTLCLLAREWEQIAAPALSADRRFLGFAWSGYEAGGYILVDRAGKGSKVDTGARPVPSPSGKRLASIEWSESGFGSLNGILILDILPDRLKESGRIDEGLENHDDWKIDRWAGDACFEVSAVPWSENGSSAARPRERHAVRPGAHGWTLGPAGSACPTA